MQLQRHYVTGETASLRDKNHPTAHRLGADFNHAMTHDGGQNLQVEKYILRNEVMYAPVQSIDNTAALKADHDDIDTDSFLPDGN